MNRRDAVKYISFAPLLPAALAAKLGAAKGGVEYAPCLRHPIQVPLPPHDEQLNRLWAQMQSMVETAVAECPEGRVINPEATWGIVLGDETLVGISVVPKYLIEEG